MNQKDKERFARVEKQLIEQGVPKSIDGLNDFLYKSFEEFKIAHLKKEISIGCKFNSEFLNVMGTNSESSWQRVWLALPIIIVLIDIILAIITKNWIILLGLPLAVFGFFSSSPFNPIRNSVSGIGMLLFICSFFFLNWTWSVILGSMLFSQIFALTAKEHYRNIIEERALNSEIFFCFMLRDGHIFISNSNKKHLNNNK
jgi:hypothetical protein